MEARDWCHCGNSIPPQQYKTAESECNQYNCPGDSGQKCGGSWRMSVYRRRKLSDHKIMSNIMRPRGTLNFVKSADAPPKMFRGLGHMWMYLDFLLGGELKAVAKTKIFREEVQVHFFVKSVQICAQITNCTSKKLYSRRSALLPARFIRILVFVTAFW